MLSGRIVIIASVLALAVGLSGGAWCYFNRGRIRALWDIHNITSYKDFVIDGEVFGEDGAPLHGVMIKVVAARQIKGGAESKDQKEVLAPQGSTFHIERNGFSDISLTVMCDGYKPQHHYFLDGGKFRDVRILLKRKVPGESKTGPIYYETHRPK